MQIVDLKEIYPSLYTHSVFLEVSDEVYAVFLADRRAEAARRRKMYRYKAQYSLDCGNGIENAVICRPPQPRGDIRRKAAQGPGVRRRHGPAGKAVPAGLCPLLSGHERNGDCQGGRRASQPQRRQHQVRPEKTVSLPVSRNCSGAKKPGASHVPRVW